MKSARCVCEGTVVCAPGVEVARGLEEPEAQILEVLEFVDAARRPAHVEDPGVRLARDDALHDFLAVVEDLRRQICVLFLYRISVVSSPVRFGAWRVFWKAT